MAKPTIPQVLPLVRALYRRNGAGCCLHIVLDDSNIHDSHVDFCIAQASASNHDDCLELGRQLRLMSKTQRSKLSRLAR